MYFPPLKNKTSADVKHVHDGTIKKCPTDNLSGQEGQPLWDKLS